jgi:hypothetical protein
VVEGLDVGGEAGVQSLILASNQDSIQGEEAAAAAVASVQTRDAEVTSSSTTMVQEIVVLTSMVVPGTMELIGVTEGVGVMGGGTATTTLTLTFQIHTILMEAMEVRVFLVGTRSGVANHSRSKVADASSRSNESGSNSRLVMLPLMQEGHHYRRLGVIPRALSKPRLPPMCRGVLCKVRSLAREG